MMAIRPFREKQLSSSLAYNNSLRKAQAQFKKPDATASLDTSNANIISKGSGCLLPVGGGSTE